MVGVHSINALIYAKAIRNFSWLRCVMDTEAIFRYIYVQYCFVLKVGSVYLLFVPNRASATPKKYTICAMPNSGAMTIIRQRPPLKNACGPSCFNVFLKLKKKHLFNKIVAQQYKKPFNLRNTIENSIELHFTFGFLQCL